MVRTEPTLTNALPMPHGVPLVDPRARTFDVAVVGAGPAGLALTSALATRGVDAVVVSPQWPPPWPNGYGLWEDELDDAALVATAAVRYEAPAYIDARGHTPLRRTYLKIDNAALFSTLSARAAAAGAGAVAARAAGVEHRRASSALQCVDDAGEAFELRARLVVDATGHSPRLAGRVGRDDPGFQTAWGAVVDADADLILRGHDMILMDFTPLAPGDDLSTFLYAMRLPDGRAFVEETTLVARPAVPIPTLERRLARRLAALGVSEFSTAGPIERCVIPMGHALPDPRSRVLAYGAAASMVQPASGYQLARALGWAPDAAEAIARALDHGATPAQVARAGYDAIWTRDRLGCRALYMFGLEALIAFPPERTRAFFREFFALPDGDWAGFLSGTLTRAQLALVMLRLFRNVSPGMRARLAAPAFGPSASHLLRALAPSIPSA
jgi:lycopene cyclase-like protein